MKSFDDKDCLTETLGRVRALHSNSARRWGRMTVNQMVCHLDDTYRMAAGERSAEGASSLWMRTGIKFIALHVPLPWPKGIATLAEVDAERDGTVPTDLSADLARLDQSLQTFVSVAQTGQCGRHPLFGRLSRAEWLRWGYLHADHHLRQFSA